MTNLQIAFCAILVASLANPLKAQTSSSTTLTRPEIAWWEFIVYPTESLQNFLQDKLESIIDVKNKNDLDAVKENDKILERLNLIANDIYNVVVKKDQEVKRAVGSVLNTEAMAQCKKLYQLWFDMGENLSTMYSKCRENKEPGVRMLVEKLQSTEHVSSDVDVYRISLRTCINTEGFLSGPRSFVCTVWVSIRWLFFSVTNRSEIDTFVDTSMDLRKLRDDLRTGEACVNTLGEKDFRNREKTIVQETIHCVNTLSGRMRNKHNV